MSKRIEGDHMTIAERISEMQHHASEDMAWWMSGEPMAPFWQQDRRRINEAFQKAARVMTERDWLLRLIGHRP